MKNMNSQTLIDSWQEEKQSAFLYEFAANSEKGTPRETLFHSLAQSANAQAAIWETELVRNGIPIPIYQPNLRTKIVAQLLRYFSPQKIKPILAAMKIRGLSVYLDNIKEAQHQAIASGGALRAGVFGVNDGLVSNASLIFGIAGATTNEHFIILSGLAGLAAGAFSMAAGEYISMRSQRELFEYQIALEKAELEQYPEEEIAELSLIYQARGLSKPDADTFAKKLLENKEHALNVLAREELGLNPNELGSPWQAAFSSFISFVIGATIPLLPFIFKFGGHYLLMSMLLTGIGLFSVGATLSLFTGRRAVYSGLRMLLIGSLAGAITYLIGYLVGV